MIKQVFVEALQTPVTIARRKGTRNMRLSIKSDGTVRLSIPYGLSENQALKFIESKRDWIIRYHKPAVQLHDGDHIGKSHRLTFIHADTSAVRTRIKQRSAQVIIPLSMYSADPEAQKAAKKVAERALAKEAVVLLPQRLQTLANQHNIEYASVTTKKLKSRWGSCDNRKHIILNNYLIQLDWRLIDYVILHELAHTKHQHHQSSFWDFLSTILPEWKARRKEIKQKPTDIFTTNF